MARVTFQIQNEHDQELQADARKNRVPKNTLILAILKRKVGEKSRSKQIKKSETK